MSISGREFVDELDTIPGPEFKDGCDHGHNAFVGTVQYVEIDKSSASGFVKKFLDVYVFDAERGQHVCLRYGNEPHEYYSPGTTIEFFKAAVIHGFKMIDYARAADLLLSRGEVVWKWKPVE